MITNKRGFFHLEFFTVCGYSEDSPRYFVPIAGNNLQNIGTLPQANVVLTVSNQSHLSFHRQLTTPISAQKTHNHNLPAIGMASDNQTGPLFSSHISSPLN